MSGANAVGLSNSGDIFNNTPGVTTRLQREQIQQQQRLEQPQNLSVVLPSAIPVSSSLSTSSAVTELTSMDVSASDVQLEGTMTINYLNVPDTSRSSTPQPSAVTLVKPGAESSLIDENVILTTPPPNGIAEKLGGDVPSSSITVGTTTFGSSSTPR